MADRIAIMKRGRVVKSGTLEELRAESGQGRKFLAALAAEPRDAESLRTWLHDHTLDFTLDGDRLMYIIPWDTQVAARGELAGALQRVLSSHGAPFHELEEEQISLESVYLAAMAGKDESLPAVRGGKEWARKVTESLPAARGGQEGASTSSPPAISGIPARVMFGSIRKQGRMLGHALPFYVSSWWRRGDLSWVMYLNAFVLLLVGGTSLFGQLPFGASQVAQRFAGGQALQAGLLLPLFFMSFALLESIKSSIGIWWEKAQQSLEVLLYTPIDDPSLIWLEVLPGAVVSTVWVTLWMGAGMTLLSFFGESAPWDLLPVFAFVAIVTSYWAAMGRMLGFMLFPREGASG